MCKQWCQWIMQKQHIVKLLYESFAKRKRKGEKPMVNGEAIGEKNVDGKLSNPMLWRKEKCIKSRTKWRKTVSKGENVSKRKWLIRGCTLLEMCTESHRSRSANPSWQWKRLTESLVLLFPLPSIYVWQMFPPDAPVYVWVPCQLPPGCDFHLSRVAEGKNINITPSHKNQLTVSSLKDTRLKTPKAVCLQLEWPSGVNEDLQPLTRLQLNHVGLICEGCSVTINFQQLIWHIWLSVASCTI